MAKIYPYIVCYLLGAISMLILIWYTKKPQIEQHIGKIKQKGGPGNVMDTDVDMNVTPEKSKKELRQDKREDRRADKKLKKEAEKLMTSINK